MEQIKKTLADLMHTYDENMAQFKSSLKQAPQTAANSSLESQFDTFRTFVMNVFNLLGQQVQNLINEQDRADARSRRKMLLVHGVAGSTDDLKEDVVTVLSEHLGSDNIKLYDIKRCHRLRQSSDEKASPPVLLKFSSLESRDTVWYSKRALKGTGVTITEFLTKPRHSAFIAGRQRYGMSRCWTKNGTVIVSGPDGKQHRVTTIADLDTLPFPTVPDKPAKVAPGPANKLIKKVPAGRVKKASK